MSQKSIVKFAPLVAAAAIALSASASEEKGLSTNAHELASAPVQVSAALGINGTGITPGGLGINGTGITPGGLGINGTGIAPGVTK